MTRWFVGSFALIALSWVGWLAIAVQPNFFPERVPIHWNIEMEADAWTSGESAIWWLTLLPATMMILLGLNWLLPKLSPVAFANFETRSKLDYTICVTLGFFLILAALVVVGMRTGELPIRPLVASFFVLFGLLGWAMRGLKRNEWLGVRTPWTLKGDAVWNRTHDFAAKCWLGLGAVGLVAVAVGIPPIVCLGLILPAALAPVVASYVFAKE